MSASEEKWRAATCGFGSSSRSRISPRRFEQIFDGATWDGGQVDLRPRLQDRLHLVEIRRRGSGDSYRGGAHEGGDARRVIAVCASRHDRSRV